MKMNDKALEKAIKVLKIQDVWQSRASAKLSEEFLTRLDFPQHFRLEYQHQVSRTILGELENAEPEHYAFRVQLVLGIRYIEAKRATKKKKDSKKKTNSTAARVLAVIEASYIADYRCEENPGEDALDAFAQNNASFHVWPFWREFVACQANRMNLPKPTLPLIRTQPLVQSITSDDQQT